MKVFGKEREEGTNRRKRMVVDILGRGERTLTVAPNATVSEIKSSLDLSSNVRAVDDEGNQLSSSSKVKHLDRLNFVPNVKGGM